MLLSIPRRSFSHTRRKILGKFSLASSIATWLRVRFSQKSFVTKVSELKNSSPSRHLFWQTTLSIVLGVVTGLVILSFNNRRPAQALVTSTIPAPAISSPFGRIEILPMLQERMNVLVMGVDSNGLSAERFTNTRSDTMILVSMDPIAHKVGIVSIPRDSRVKIAGNHGLDKINAAHAFGGPQLSMQTVGENFSVPIDHYVVIDTQALKELCNLLGPVEVLVEKEMKYTDWSAHLHIDLKPGLQVLQPEQVEQYVRFRHDARGDIGRMERQQWFFRSAAKKMKDPQFLLRLPDLLRMAHEYVKTDMSIEDMARVAAFGKDLRPEDVVTATLPGTAEMINGGSYWIPDMEASKIVFNRMLGIGGGGAFVDAPATTLNENGEPVAVAVSTKPVVVAIKYAKESQELANQLEKKLTDAGYRVRYKWMMPASECQHEQIVQMSGRADDAATQKMRTDLPDLNYMPVVLALEPRPIADFTIVVASDSDFSPVASQPSGHAVARPILPN